MKIKRGYLFSATFGSLIGTNMNYEINDLMFWVIAFPILVIGIIIYYKLEE